LVDRVYVSFYDFYCFGYYPSFKQINQGIPAPYKGLAAVILVIVTLLYGGWNAQNPRVVNYNLEIPKKAGEIQELQVVMVSDLHLSKVVHNGRLKEMVDKINALNPDLVLMPGDLIQDAQFFVEQNMVETFGELKPKRGTFISLGNHEYYGGEVKETVDSLERAGIHVLRDSYAKVFDSLYIVGRDDPAVGRSGALRKDLKVILDGVDKSLPIILLNHQPIELNEAQKEGVDLQVSGHTHGGQIFPANLVTSRLFEQDWGYLRKDTLQLIVTSGYGTWGPAMRIGNTPEIVNILITFEK